MAEATVTIGEAARRLGVSTDTLRYYERRGLLPKAARTTNGYRRYTARQVQQIAFVRNALRVGFTLKQIGAFRRAKESGRPPCREVRAAAGRLLEEMEHQIADMIASRAAMQAMLAEWDARLAAMIPGQPAHLLELPVASVCRAARLPHRVR